jgi:hypothetical protein
MLRLPWFNYLDQFRLPVGLYLANCPIYPFVHGTR